MFVPFPWYVVWLFTKLIRIHFFACSILQPHIINSACGVEIVYESYYLSKIISEGNGIHRLTIKENGCLFVNHFYLYLLPLVYISPKNRQIFMNSIVHYLPHFHRALPFTTFAFD